MHLSSSRLTSSNIQHCLPFWGGGDGHSSSELVDVVNRAALLLDEGGARGVLIADRSGPVSYGLTVFVTEPFAESCLAVPQALVGKRVLLHEPDTVVMDELGVGSRNAGDGLQMLVASQGWDETHIPRESHDAIVAEMLGQFVDMHRGYRLARIINEVIGETGIADVGASDAFASYHLLEYVTGGGAVGRSLLAVIDREYAVARRSLLMPMFSYTPPQVCFTRAERELLRIAVEGGTDSDLAETLGIPVTSVKARWTRIQRRVTDRLPALLPSRPETAAGAARGAQVRHMILRFVRTHPEELTPYVSQSTARG